MKLIKAFFLFILFFPFCVKADLLVVEIQIRGEVSSNDFIKIYNSSNQEINIEGYKLRKRTSSGKEYSIRVFPKTSSIPGKGYFLWANSRDSFHETINADIWSTATIAQNNSIALLDPENKIIDAVTWGENQGPFNEKGINENPEIKLIRKSSSGIYQNTKDNSQDFYFFPLPESKTVITENKTEDIIKNNKEELIEKIDINTASTEDLVKITNIGEIRAEEIVSLRPFYSVDDLIRVRGIGEKTIENIKDQGLVYVKGEEEKILEKKEKQSAPIYQENPIKNASSSAFFIAIVVSLFSGTTIYFLRRSA